MIDLENLSLQRHYYWPGTVGVVLCVGDPVPSSLFVGIRLIVVREDIFLSGESMI